LPRHRSDRTQGWVSRATIYKLGMSAEKRWQRLRGFQHLAKVKVLEGDECVMKNDLGGALGDPAFLGCQEAKLPSGRCQAELGNEKTRNPSEEGFLGKSRSGCRDDDYVTTSVRECQGTLPRP
jgi:hypothetical protein